MFSNKAVPLLLEDDDRRLCIVDRRGVDPIIDDWKTVEDTLIYNDYAAEVLAAIYRRRWLMMPAANKRAILSERPPATDAKTSIIEAAISPMDEFIEDLQKNTSGHGPLWTSDGLKEHLAYEKKNEPRYRGLGYRMVLKHLKDAGAWMPGNHPAGQVRGTGPGGKRSVVWAVYEDESRGLSQGLKLPDDEIRDLMSEYAVEDDDNVIPLSGAGTKEEEKEGRH
jgi:hypothetical protein